MLKGQVDSRLEKRFVELYAQHKERSAKIDWSYHEFLPLPGSNANAHTLNREDLFTEEVLKKPAPGRQQLSPETYLRSRPRC